MQIVIKLSEEEIEKIKSIFDCHIDNEYDVEYFLHKLIEEV